MEPADVNITATILPYDGFMFSLEENFDSVKVLNVWKNHCHLGIYVTLAYLVGIVSLRHFMKDRKAYDLRRVLMLWNLGTSVFSILCMWRSLTDFYSILKNYGFYYSICSTLRYSFMDLWFLLCHLSKVLQLGDTLFVLLRKRPLSFLHWYHHSIALLMVSCVTDENFTIGRWFLVFNSSVHSLLYSYLFIRSLNIRMPKIFSMFVTGCQVVEMVMAVVITLITYFLKSSGHSCPTSYRQLNIFVIVYITFVFLFSKFFYDSFMTPKLPKKTN